MQGGRCGPIDISRNSINSRKVRRRKECGRLLILIISGHPRNIIQILGKTYSFHCFCQALAGRGMVTRNRHTEQPHEAATPNSHAKRPHEAATPNSHTKQPRAAARGRMHYMYTMHGVRRGWDTSARWPLLTTSDFQEFNKSQEG